MSTSPPLRGPPGGVAPPLPASSSSSSRSGTRTEATTEARCPSTFLHKPCWSLAKWGLALKAASAS
eukprot:6878415-Pyramimonas_sp.AAC.1